MATSTTRTFSAGYQGPTTSDSVQLSQSAEARALAIQAQGLQAEQSRRDEAARRAQQTAYYQGQGNYRTLGGQAGYRPRGNVSSGGVAIGQRVPSNGGLVGGMPAAGEGDRAALLALTERVAGVARERGWQIAAGDPNDDEVQPRYPNDIYLDITTPSAPTLYFWQATVGSTPGEWVEIPLGGAPPIIYGTGNPNGTLASNASAVPWVANGQYYDKAIGRLYVAWEVGDDPAIRWVPVSTHNFDPASPAESGYYPNDTYQAGDGAFYRLNASGNWIMQYVCPDCEEMPTEPPDPCTPAWLYGSGAIAEGATQIYFPCS